jgi:hypothetical protein
MAHDHTDPRVSFTSRKSWRKKFSLKEALTVCNETQAHPLHCTLHTCPFLVLISSIFPFFSTFPSFPSFPSFSSFLSFPSFSSFPSFPSFPSPAASHAFTFLHFSLQSSSTHTDCYHFPVSPICCYFSPSSSIHAEFPFRWRTRK